MLQHLINRLLVAIDFNVRRHCHGHGLKHGFQFLDADTVHELSQFDLEVYRSETLPDAPEVARNLAGLYRNLNTQKSYGHLYFKEPLESVDVCIIAFMYSLK